MKQKVTLQFAVLLMLFMSLPLAAKVTGLPDFTELVEKAGPAVVNIRVTQFGTRGPGGIRPAMMSSAESRVKITRKYPSFSDVISMCPMIPATANRIVPGQARASYMMRRVIF